MTQKILLSLFLFLFYTHANAQIGIAYNAYIPDFKVSGQSECKNLPNLDEVREKLESIFTQMPKTYECHILERRKNATILDRIEKEIELVGKKIALDSSIVDVMILVEAEYAAKDLNLKISFIRLMNSELLYKDIITIPCEDWVSSDKRNAFLRQWVSNILGGTSQKREALKPINNNLVSKRDSLPTNASFRLRLKDKDTIKEEIPMLLLSTKLPILGTKLSHKPCVGIYRTQSVLTSGTEFQLEMNCSQYACLYLIGSDLTGVISNLYEGEIWANSPQMFPEGFNIQLDATKGLDYMCVLLTSEPIELPPLLKKLENTNGSFTERINTVLEKDIINKENILFEEKFPSFKANIKGKKMIATVIEIEHQ